MWTLAVVKPQVSFSWNLDRFKQFVQISALDLTEEATYFIFSDRQSHFKFIINCLRYKKSKASSKLWSIVDYIYTACSILILLI